MLLRIPDVIAAHITPPLGAVCHHRRRFGGRIRRAGSVAIAALMLVTGSRAARAQAPDLSAARVASQVTLGTLAAPVAFFGAGVAAKRTALALGAGNERAGRAAYVSAYTATWLATAAVPAAVAGDGKFPAALGGSALGMLASVGVVRLGNWRYDGDRRNCGPLCWTLGAAVVALPGIGATLLYNASRN